MTSLSSELKTQALDKRARTSQCLYDNMVDARPLNFFRCKSGIDCFGRNNCYETLEVAQLKQMDIIKFQYYLSIFIFIHGFITFQRTIILHYWVLFKGIEFGWVVHRCQPPQGDQKSGHSLFCTNPPQLSLNPLPSPLPHTHTHIDPAPQIMTKECMKSYMKYITVKFSFISTPCKDVPETVS